VNSFEALGLSAPLIKATQALDYERPTDIQIAAIPHLISGDNIAAEAKTGSGKTAAFALPILQKLSKLGPISPPIHVQVLTLVPTRELALQVAESFRALARFEAEPPPVLAVIGGASIDEQCRTLSNGVSIVVATPGRLIDLLERQVLDLHHVHTLVLDEADKLLDAGFNEELNILMSALPPNRQSMLFSATMPPRVISICARVMPEYTVVRTHTSQPIVQEIKQRAIQVDKEQRRPLLQHLIKSEHLGKTLVFVATQRAAENLSRKLRKDGFYSTALHGGLMQDERNDALKRFKNGRVKVLIATDVAARGIDVPGLSTVINFDLPRSPQDYIHRIGRTGRAGESGVAISFVDHETEAHLRVIEKKNQLHLGRETKAGFELCGEPAQKAKGPAPTKGYRKSKKDKLRELKSD
jgi:superfamily II DNA/RNA helicase